MFETVYVETTQFAIEAFCSTVFRNAFMVKVAVATSCLQKTLQTT